MVNFYEDNTCQVVVHTANLLRIDWEDKAQAIWCSPRLPKLKMCAVEKTSIESHGDQFKHDLLAYFRAYKLPSIQSLILRLHEMDFSMVRAVFIASVPGVYAESSSNFGFCRLRHVDCWPYRNVGDGDWTSAHPHLHHGRAYPELLDCDECDYGTYHVHDLVECYWAGTVFCIGPAEDF